MRRLSKDDKAAVLGLPLELLVICVVMVISIPGIWMFADMYIERQVEEDLTGDLDHLKDTILEVEAMGEGNKRVITLDYTDHLLARIDYVRVGGNGAADPGAPYRIRYSIDGDEDGLQLGNNPVSNISQESMDTVEIPEGGATLRIKMGDLMIDGERVVDIGILEE